MAFPLTVWNLKVDAVAEVCVTAVRVEQALGAQAVDGLSWWYQADLRDTDSHLLLLLTVDVGGGGHAGPVCLAHITGLLTSGAVTLKSWKERNSNMTQNNCASLKQPPGG